MPETNPTGLRIREAYRTAERLIDAEFGPAYKTDHLQQSALREFFAPHDDDECRHRTGALIMALTEYAARAVDRAVEAGARPREAEVA